MGNNTAPEMYDEDLSINEDNPTTQDEILMNENDILAGLLELGKTKDEAANYRKIQIKRNGVLKLEFRIRPITEDESQNCLKSSHKYAPTKPGQPKKIIETDTALYRSRLIYTATVNGDRKKVWENKQAQMALNVLQGVDMIDAVLLAGEKSHVLDVIDEISGFNDESAEAEKNAKN